MLKVGSLFSGAGLCDLGLQWAGFRHQWFCEINSFCRAVLARHWPGIPIYEDVKKLKGDELPPVDVLCGGFPCQDVSHREENMRELRKGRAAACGSNTHGSSGKCVPGTSSLKTSGGCSPMGLRSSCKIWPRSGMMRNGKCFPQPPLAPLIGVSACLLLPTPTVTSLTQSIGCYCRSKESWEKATNLLAYLIGLEYGLSGKAAKPSGAHILAPSFIEWMMGVPEGWTIP